MANPNILNAINEINSVEFNQPSEWLDALKLSASLAVRENDPGLITDDISQCKMTESEYEEFQEEIKEEAYYHDPWDEMNLERRVVRHSEKYVNAWNSIITILIKYEIDRINKKWLMEPIDGSVLIDKFCQYELPKDALIEGSWSLPQWFINGIDDPKAPSWDFEFPGFTAYIRSVKKTDEPNQLEIEYCVYKCNIDHCNRYYQHWDSGKAMVDISTHRRWMIEQ